MGEGRGADVRSRAARHAVEDVVERARDAGERGQRVVAHARLEAGGERLLEHERRNQRHQIGVAAALAQAPERALDLARARLHGRERARHRLAGVVVGVDPEPLAGDAGGDHLPDHRADAPRQRAAVGVAEHDPPRARIQRGVQAVERVGGIGGVSVEEVLGVEERLAAAADAVGDRGADRLDVLAQPDAERRADMELVRLADEADGRRAGVQHRGQRRVVLGRAPGALGHPERGQRGPHRGRGVEERAVGRIRAGPAALDVVHPERVQERCDAQLFLDGELDALGLLAVAERGVVEAQTLHEWRPPPMPRARPGAPITEARRRSPQAFSTTRRPVGSATTGARRGSRSRLKAGTAGRGAVKRSPPAWRG